MSATQDSRTVARWSVGGVFLEALANRDFDQMAATLAPTVRLRAMLPPGPMDWEGPEAVSAVFGSWFGDAEGFEPGPKRGVQVAGSSFGASSRLHALSAENAKWPRIHAG